MAHRITKRRKVILSQAIHPEYRKVIQTYIDPDQQEIILVLIRNRKAERMKGSYLISSTGKSVPL